MTHVTAHYGEPPLQGYTLDLTPEEADAVMAVLNADVHVKEVHDRYPLSALRRANPAVYDVIMALKRAGVRAS